MIIVKPSLPGCGWKDVERRAIYNTQREQEEEVTDEESLRREEDVR